MPKVSVIILNWNGKQFLKDCLNAVFNQTYNDFEVVFVDNASSDGSADFVKHEFPHEIKSGKLKLVINDRNYGFAEGNNIGVRNSSPDSEYIALLNNDTVVDSNWLEELVRILDEDKTVGAVCSLDTGPVGRLEAIDNPVGVLGHTAVYSYAGLERLTEPFETLFPGGAATLYRRALQSSPFDPDFFGYSEDVYLGLSLRLKGYSIKENPRSKFVHYSGTVKRMSMTMNRHLIYTGERNRILNILLFYQTKNIVKLIPMLVITETLQNMFMPKYFLLKIKGYVWILRNIPRILQKRRTIQGMRVVDDDELFKLMSCRIMREDVFNHPLAKFALALLNAFSTVYCRALGIRTREFYHEF